MVNQKILGVKKHKLNLICILKLSTSNSILN